MENQLPQIDITPLVNRIEELATEKALLLKQQDNYDKLTEKLNTLHYHFKREQAKNKSLLAKQSKINKDYKYKGECLIMCKEQIKDLQQQLEQKESEPQEKRIALYLSRLSVQEDFIDTLKLCYNSLENRYKLLEKQLEQYHNNNLNKTQN